MLDIFKFKKVLMTFVLHLPYFAFRSVWFSDLWFYVLQEGIGIAFAIGFIFPFQKWFLPSIPPYHRWLMMTKLSSRTTTFGVLLLLQGPSSLVPLIFPMSWDKHMLIFMGRHCLLSGALLQISGVLAPTAISLSVLYKQVSLKTVARGIY